MVDADAVVLLEGAGLVVPERVLVRPAIAGLEGFGQAEILQAAEGGAGLRQSERVGVPDAVVPAVIRRRDAVIVAADHERLFGAQHLRGLMFQRLGPFQLVIILLARRGIAVRHVDACDPDRAGAHDRRFDVAGGIVLQGRHLLRDVLQGEFREDRDPVIGFLAMHGAVPAPFLDLEIGESAGLALQLLQAHDIRRDGVQDFQHGRQPGLDRVDVPGGDAHASS